MNLEGIKGQVNLIEYASRLGLSCNSKGMAICPWHADKKPSLQIHQHDGRWTWKCFACDIGGSIVDLLMRCESIDEKVAIKKLLDEYGDNIKRGRVREGSTPEIERAHIYRDLEGREVLRKVKYKKNPRGMTWIFQHKGENGSWQPKTGTQELIPYRLDTFKGQETAIICEGEKDADRVAGLGFPMATTSSPTGQGNLPVSIIKYFKSFKGVVFLYDVGAEKQVERHAATLKEAYPELEIIILSVPLEAREADISDYLDQAKDENAAFKVLLDTAAKLREGADEDVIEFRLSDVTPRPLSWLWYNRILLGSYSCICGDPGGGKSIFISHICARLTKGTPLPDRQLNDPKGTVLYYVAEENLQDTVRVRAEDAGADLSKFIVIPGEKKGGGFFSLSDPEDLKDLEKKIKRHGDVVCVVFDTLTTYLGNISGIDECKVRAAMAPLIRLAEKYHIAIIGIAHLNKDQQKNFLYRLSGTIAFMALARAVWLIKKDDDTNQRYFAPLKYNNLKDPTTLTFKIDGDLGHPIIEFESMPSDITVEQLLANGESQAAFSAIQEARIFLDDLMPPGEAMPCKEIYKVGKLEGHSNRTLERAKKQLGILSRKEIDGWHWYHE